MNKSLQVTIIVVASIIGAAVLIAGGVLLGQIINRDYPQDVWGMGPGMMRRNWNNYQPRSSQPFGMGPGMMGRGFSYRNDIPSENVISIENARTAFEQYLDNFESENLSIDEIMIFDRNAYAVISEEDSGYGAMELLVDPDSMQVFPEYGPNHMWNLKYGWMGGQGCGRAMGMLCQQGFQVNNVEFNPAEMDVSIEEAGELAENYLDGSISGDVEVEEGITFYGYYTFDYMVDGEMAGMLSVNGFTGQVWPHTWHGQFIEEWERAETE